MDDLTISEIQKAVERAFASGVEKGRFVDISRIPLICQSIVRIDENLNEMKENIITKDQFWPVKNLVYGLVTMMLTSVIGALMVLVIK